MNALSRIVEGWMGHKLYRKLGSVPDVELAWELIREFVGDQLFESEYVMLPHFDSAIYYNQMFVFKKKRSVSIETVLLRDSNRNKAMRDVF